jgi:hypothetical protein
MEKNDIASELLAMAKELTADEKQVVFHAFTRGKLWEVVGYSNGEYEELKHGRGQAHGGPYSNIALAHRLAAIIQDSKVIDGINYQIDIDKLSVKQILERLDPTIPTPSSFLKMSSEKVAMGEDMENHIRIIFEAAKKSSVIIDKLAKSFAPMSRIVRNTELDRDTSNAVDAMINARAALSRLIGVCSSILVEHETAFLSSEK